MTGAALEYQLKITAAAEWLAQQPAFPCDGYARISEDFGVGPGDLLKAALVSATITGPVQDWYEAERQCSYPNRAAVRLSNEWVRYLRVRCSDSQGAA